jgi:hypothetical protein
VYTSRLIYKFKKTKPYVAHSFYLYRVSRDVLPHPQHRAVEQHAHPSAEDIKVVSALIVIVIQPKAQVELGDAIHVEVLENTALYVA